MNVTREKNIVYIKNEEGKIIAYASFPPMGEGVVNLNHTVVDESLRGQGVAGILMENAYLEIKSQGLRCHPSCSYAVGWFEKHPEKKDIL